MHTYSTHLTLETIQYEHNFNNYSSDNNTVHDINFKCINEESMYLLFLA